MTIDTLTADHFPRTGTQPAHTTDRTYMLVLRRHLQISDVTRLLHYVSDFGTGDARGHAHDGGWSIRLSDMADVRLLTSQCGDLIEDLVIQRQQTDSPSHGEKNNGNDAAERDAEARQDSQAL